MQQILKRTMTIYFSESANSVPIDRRRFFGGCDTVRVAFICNPRGRCGLADQQEIGSGLSLPTRGLQAELAHDLLVGDERLSRVSFLRGLDGSEVGLVLGPLQQGLEILQR